MSDEHFKVRIEKQKNSDVVELYIFSRVTVLTKAGEKSFSVGEMLQPFMELTASNLLALQRDIAKVLGNEQEKSVEAFRSDILAKRLDFAETLCLKLAEKI